MIDASQYPYQTPVIVKYDSGDPKSLPGKGAGGLRLGRFCRPARKNRSRAANLRGIGLCTYVEACGLAPSRIVQSLGARAGIFESATVRVHVTGDVTVLIGTHNHGQGHETTFAQIVSEKLSIPTDKIEIVFGDTDRVQFGLGTYGSRSLAVGGTALSKATDKIIAKGTKIAAHMLEAGESDIVFENGAFTVQGTDRAKSFGDVVGAAYGLVNFPIDVLEPGMEAQAFYDPVNFTYPGGAHIAEVEIDPDCGSVDLVSYVAVDDIGTVINPMIVAGQLHGGIAQGVGQALFENCVYDETSGQMLSASFMDYCMPRADNMPKHGDRHPVDAVHAYQLRRQGCGEVGTIGSPATVINAVVDALSHLGVSHVDMPATPSRICASLTTAPISYAQPNRSRR